MKNFNRVISPPILETIEGLVVVRDDLLPGGTKARVIPSLLATGSAQEHVYASPAYGYAQIALAYSCGFMGRKCTIFVAKRAKPHARTLEAKAAGAKVIQVPHGYLNVVQAAAMDYCSLTGAQYLPFGLASPQFFAGMAAVARGIKIQPKEVWVAAGSGSLCRALQLAWPKAKFFAVQVGKVPRVGKAELLVAPEKFEVDAKHPPPFPSCSNYDAKVWQFAKANASPGALFWNVAG